MSRTASPSRDGRTTHATIILSSSPDLSSPPRSDSDPSPFVTQPAQFGRHGHARSLATGLGLGGVDVASSSSAAANAANSKTPSLRSANPATSGATTKKSSRKRERPDDAGGGGGGENASARSRSKTSTSTATVPKPRKRKTREPVKRKTSDSIKVEAQQPPQQQQPTQQTLLPSRKAAIAHLVDSDVPAHDVSPQPPPSGRASRHDEFISENGNSEATTTYIQPAQQRKYPQQTQLPFANPHHTNQTATSASVSSSITSPPTRTSGTKYDPIRSVSMEATGPHDTSRFTPQNQSPLKPAKGASASPSISSLIDPPSAPTTTATTSMATVTATAKPTETAHVSPLSRFVAVTSDADVGAPFVARSTLQPSAQPLRPLPHEQRRPSRSADEGAPENASMSAVPAATSKTTTKKGSTDASTGGSPANSSPKPSRQKEPPPPSGPTGSGLLSSALFGGPTSVPGQSSADHRPPTIVLELPIRTESDRYINFAKLAEERYGFSALHPRLAAHKDRLARAAAAGATLERMSGVGSADEMSLDVSEPESNAEMAGTEGSGDNGDKNSKPKRKRKAKTDDYNKDDPFIDDSEMLWQEQAAASKDGFFVYEGPLLQPGEKPAIERADGTVRRGRGRGRGGSSRGGGTGRGGAAAAGDGASSGRASSRGGGTARKPRITKADRARMEQEKHEREKMAPLAAKPSTYVG